MRIKDALWREITFGLCGSGGDLEGLLAAERVKLDKRLEPDSARVDSNYPWLIIRRITSSEDNQVKYARERIEIEIIGLHSSATKGDDLLEQIREVLLDHFSGKMKTYGKFTEGGTAEPGGGLKLKCFYVSTVEGFDEDMEEKAHILIFLFHHVRA